MYVNKIFVDCSIGKVNDERNYEMDRLYLYCSLNKGEMMVVNLLPFCNEFTDLSYVDHCNTRINYNALRGGKEDFLKMVEGVE